MRNLEMRGCLGSWRILKVAPRRSGGCFVGGHTRDHGTASFDDLRSLQLRFRAYAESPLTMQIFTL